MTILAHTPWWVFAVLAVLIVTGIQALRPRVIAAWRLLIVPAIFIAWGIASVSIRASAVHSLALDWLAAVVIGGGSLSGGRGSVLGAMLGAYLLGALRNAFILLELSPFLQQMSVGLVIVAAALFDQFRQGNFRYVLPFGLSFRRMGAERKRPE